MYEKSKEYLGGNHYKVPYGLVCFIICLRVHRGAGLVVWMRMEEEKENRDRRYEGTSSSDAPVCLAKLHRRHRSRASESQKGELGTYRSPIHHRRPEILEEKS
jgi:hypothetical protein